MKNYFDKDELISIAARQILNGYEDNKLDYKSLIWFLNKLINDINEL